jgi:hypothetical protein
MAERKAYVTAYDATAKSIRPFPSSAPEKGDCRFRSRPTTKTHWQSSNMKGRGLHRSDNFTGRGTNYSKAKDAIFAVADKCFARIRARESIRPLNRPGHIYP